MDNINNFDVAAAFLDEAYKCEPSNLEFLLQKIELEIKNSDNVDNILLRAKMVVTSKIALINSKWL